MTNVLNTAATALRRCSASAGTPAAYAAVSAIACVCDFAITMALAATAAPAALTAAVGYLFGAAVHWTLSTRFVFVNGAALAGFERHRQKALFLLSGLVGLCATVAVYSPLSAVGVAPVIAKAFAVAASFTITYIWRRYFIFHLPHSAPAC